MTTDFRSKLRNSQNRRRPRTYTCVICSNVFTIRPHNTREPMKYCSAQCRTTGKHNNMLGKNKKPNPKQQGSNNPNWQGGKIEAVCDYCGESYGRAKPYFLKKRTHGKMFCGRACHYKWLRESGATRGENSAGWKGGKTNINVAIRQSTEYAHWRTSVFKRDGYACQAENCNTASYASNLNADHKKPLSWIIADNNIESMEQARNCAEIWDISNGRTLCIPCHRKTPTYGIGSIRKNKEELVCA